MLGIIRYEKLPMFCYGCGLMEHIERNCSRKTDTTGKGYGFWLITAVILSKCIWQTEQGGSGVAENLSSQWPEGGAQQELLPSNHELAMTDRQQKAREPPTQLDGKEVPQTMDHTEDSSTVALLWNDGINVEVQSYSEGHIDTMIKLDEDQTWWRFTGFYGNPVTSQ